MTKNHIMSILLLEIVVDNCKTLRKMHNPPNLRRNLLFSSITLAFFTFSENSISSEGRIQAATKQNAQLPNVDNPGKISFIILFPNVAIDSPVFRL